jgi:Tol biopolymer transport system component
VAIETDHRVHPREKSRKSRWLVLAAAGLVATVLVAPIMWITHRVRRDPLLRAVPLTSLPGIEGQPVFSPDGNQVAFCWYGPSEDNLDVYVKIIGTESLLRLTHSSEQESSPAWSPDGRFIAFHRNTGDGSGFYVLPALGGRERKLASAFPARFHARGRTVDWFPDGKSLAVVERQFEEESFGVSVIFVETGERRRLFAPKPPTPGAMGLAVAPDGEHVAFASTNTNGSDGYRMGVDLYLVSKRGEQPKRLSHDSAFVVGISWMPDSRSIVFTGTRNVHSSNYRPLHRFWQIDVSGDNLRPLPVESPSACNPAISRQGNRLVYEERETGLLNIWRVPGPTAQGGLGTAVKLISSIRSENGGQYSPDGSRITFYSDRAGTTEIWACNQDGSDAVQLTSIGQAQTGWPRWSPDGEWIAFRSTVSGTEEIYVVSAKGGQARRLDTGGPRNGPPSWSRDGRWIYFSSNRSGRSEIWKIQTEGGRPIQMTRNGGALAFESADGRFLYYAKPIGLNWTFAHASIWRMPTEGGEETRVVDRTALGYWGVYAGGLCFLDTRGNLPFAMRSLDEQTGHTGVIGAIDREPFWDDPAFGVSPDGRWVIYSKRDYDERDLMLVERFE